MATAVIFNPISGEFDFVGTSGGGPAVQSPNYVATFNNPISWGAASGGNYSLVIPVATHGKGQNPVVQILELSGSDYMTIGISHKVDSLGNITIQVSETPDLRFNGKIIIAENN